MFAACVELSSNRIDVDEHFTHFGKLIKEVSGMRLAVIAAEPVSLAHFMSIML